MQSQTHTAIIMLAGPIKYWWDENWNSPEHLKYAEWRELVSSSLVDAGYLVYRPHEAFKGRWDERAQSINDLVLRTSDVICNLTPPGVPSLGTDGEILYAKNHANALVVPAPPTQNFEEGIKDLIQRLQNLNIHRKFVDQELLLDSIPTRPGQEWKARAAIKHFKDHVKRVHFFDSNGRVQALDVKHIEIDSENNRSVIYEISDNQILVDNPNMLKIEILDKKIT